MFFSFLKSKKNLIILVACILVLAPSSYAGSSYCQSNKLIKEAGKLADAGDYAGAIAKYDQAQKKWKWNDKKITPKKNIAIKFQDQTKILAEVEVNFGDGEWQKCLDSLTKIEKDFPEYSQAQDLNTSCQKKLDEQNAVIAAKAVADATAAKAAEEKATKQTATQTVAKGRYLEAIIDANSSSYLSLFQDGKVIWKQAIVLGGPLDLTPEGSFVITEKLPEKSKIINSTTTQVIKWWQRFSGGYGIHEIGLLGGKTEGCIGLNSPGAEELYNLTTIGTPVYVKYKSSYSNACKEAFDYVEKKYGYTFTPQEEG